MQRTDLTIFKSQSLAQHENAGGYRSANAVVNGKLNDVFTAISDVAFARSEFDLVKLYPSVNTQTSEVLADAHVFLSELPSDPLVKTLLIESPLLADADKLPRMRELVTDASTKYHGLTHLTALANAGDSSLAIAASNAQLLPKVTNTETLLNQLAFVHNAAHGTRSVSITPLQSSYKLNVDIADFMQAYGWQLRYVANDGSQNGKLLTLSANNLQGAVITYNQGQLVLDLALPTMANQALNVTYYSSQDYRHHQFITAPNIVLAAGETILPGSVKVKSTEHGQLLVDNGDGKLIDAERSLLVSQIDYATGVFSNPSAINTTGTLADGLGCFIRTAGNVGSASEIGFYLGSTQFNAGSVHLVITRADDSQFAVDAAPDGTITHAEITGTISGAGYVLLTPVGGLQVKRVNFDVTLTSETVIDAPWLGLNTAQLPNNGLVNVFNQDGQVIVLNRERTELASLTPSATISTLTDADYIDISDATGASLYTVENTHYSYDKATGNITLGTDFSSFTAPFVLTAVKGELATVTKVNATELRLLTGLKFSYPQGALVASVQVLGDLGALAFDGRSQSAWNNDFAQNGAAGSSSLNFAQHPIVLNNKGAINQRWAVVFSSTSAFTVFGETVGSVGSGDTLNDFAPINALHNEPFFVLPSAALAGGLQPGECYLFETKAAAKPIMLSRAISPGHSNIEFDSSTLAFRGSI